MKKLSPLSKAFLCILLLFVVQFSMAQVITPFNVRYQTTQKGGIVYLANVAVGCSSNPQTSGGSCQTGSTAVAPAGTSNNNDFNQVYVDIDNDATTFQSSSDSLALPNCSQITWAGLYWGAQGNAATAPTRNDIKIKVNNGSYLNISADRSQLNTAGYTSYHNFKDVTSIVKSAGTNARFTVANIPFINNGASNNWGSWTIVVVYGNQLQGMRQLTVFDGLANVTGSNTVNVPVSGFLTPPTGPINFELGTYVHDGDRGLTGDQMLFSGASNSFINISDAMNTSTNVFNSTVTNKGVATPFRKPFLGNTMGLDADIFQPDNSTKNYLGNSNTSATLRLTTGGETYLVQEISTAIDVFEPDVRVDKKVRDRFGVDKYLGTVAPGDTLEYSITLYNIGSDSSINTFITDSSKGTAKYVPNSAKITFGPNLGSLTDAAGDDQFDFNNTTKKMIFRVGRGANATTGGKVGNSGTGVDSTVVKFKVTAEDDCFILKCDNVVSNRAYANSTGKISGNTIITGSNPAAFDSQGCPISGTTDTYINVSLASCSFPPDTTIANICPYTQTLASLYTRPGYSIFKNSSFATVTTAIAPGTYYAIRTASTGCLDTVAITINTTTCNNQLVLNDSLVTPLNTPKSGNMGTNNNFPGYTTSFTTTPIVNPSNGGFTITPSGDYTYTPNTGFSGKDTVVVNFCGTTLVNPIPFCKSDTLFITVLPAIIVINDSAVTNVDVPIGGNINTNNSDPSGTPITINTTPVKNPSNGVISINPNGDFLYTPNPGFTGKDTVVVNVCNATTPQLCKNDTLFITVKPLDVLLGSIGNFVWDDKNANGIQDAGEAGLAGVTVKLINSIGTVIATTITDDDGFYKFSGLVAGTYTVQFVALDNYKFSPQVQGNDTAKDSDANGNGLTQTITLATGQNINTIDAGLVVNVPDCNMYATIGVNQIAQCGTNNQFAFSGNFTGGTAPFTYLWDLNDGNKPTTKDVVHTYGNYGEHDVTFIVRDSRGCEAHASTVQIYVGAKPKASFDIYSGTGDGKAYTFVSTSTIGGGWLTYNWDLGNGTTSTLVNPSTTYTNPGTYTITLIVTGNFGCSDTLSKTITTTGSPLCTIPVADFTINNETQCLSGNSFTFTNTSTGTSPNFKWDFNDGSGEVAGLNATHTYTSARTFNVMLTAVNSCGTTTKTKTVTVNSVPTTPTSISGASTVVEGLTTQFSSSPSGGVWSSNSSIATVNASSGLVSGVSAGLATISYTLTNTCGTSVTTKQITVTPACIAPIADFTINNATQCLSGNNFVFTNTSTGTTPDYKWDFNDGSAEVVSQNANRTYSSVRTFNVMLTAVNSCGTTTKTKTVTVITLPETPTAINGTSSIAVGSTTTFTNSTSGGVWTSNNSAATVNSTSGVVTAVSVGSATITYTVSNSCGAVSVSKVINVTSATVNVFPNPSSNNIVVSFTAPSNSGFVIDIYNVSNTLVSTTNIGLQTIGANVSPSINISSLASGLYFVRISDTQGNIIATTQVLKN